MLALDSNTISYHFRGDPQVVPRMQALAPADAAVPAVVAYELRFGLNRLPEAAAKSRLQALEKFLAPMQILAFDARCAEIAAALRARLEGLGTPIGPHDVLIAATAMRYGATLVTRNVREFERVPGLHLANWHAD